MLIELEAEELILEANFSLWSVSKLHLLSEHEQ